MSSLATKEVLQKELVRFEERVDFLNDYIKHLKSAKDFEEDDKAYKLSIERDFKLNLIGQRTAQIDQINEQDILKAKAVEEFPSLLDDCWLVVKKIGEDLEELRSSKKLKGAEAKERSNAIKNLLGTKEQVVTILNSITVSFENDNFHSQLLTDFRQLNAIKKIN